MFCRRRFKGTRLKASQGIMNANKAESPRLAPPPLFPAGENTRGGGGEKLIYAGPEADGISTRLTRSVQRGEGMENWGERGGGKFLKREFEKELKIFSTDFFFVRNEIVISNLFEDIKLEKNYYFSPNFCKLCLQLCSIFLNFYSFLLLHPCR